MKYLCDLCAGYENIKDHDEETDKQYQTHIFLKEESHKYKDRVKMLLTKDETLAAAAAVFDLEEVLSTP